jgi:hypothetical protein
VTETILTFEMLNHHESLLALDVAQGQRAKKGITPHNNGEHTQPH